MQFCHASKSLAESVFSNELFGNASHVFRLPMSFADPCANPSRSHTGRPPLACNNLPWVGESSTHPGWQTRRSSKGICREKGKVPHKRLLTIAFAYKTYRYTYLYPHLFSSPSHWQPAGTPSVPLTFGLRSSDPSARARL
jgi:hypothetical protein